MHKPFVTCAGCDTAKDKVDVVRRTANGNLAHRVFANTRTGHRKLLRWLGKGPVRVVVEASGIYSLDLSLALHKADGIEVMVANPRALKDYRRCTMERSKTDKVDAAVICDYAWRMDFVPWQPPSKEALELRQIARRLHAYVDDLTAAKNRRHAARSSMTTSEVVLRDIVAHIEHIHERMDELEKEARHLIDSMPALAQAYALLTSVKGIAQRSAIQLMAELLCLPDALTVREWVAYAGLDVREYESGTCVRRPRRISKVGNAHLRRALYMPAQVAIQHDPHVGAFYEKLLGEDKKSMVAVVAVMRKLLHAIYGMLKHGTPFDGAKFYQIPVPTS